MLALAAEHGIPISFFSFTGEWTGRLDTGAGEDGGGVISASHSFKTIRAQWHLAEDEEAALGFARRFVEGKIHNARSLLMHVRRCSMTSMADRAVLADAAATMRLHVTGARTAPALDALRGHEGNAARAYFAGLPCCIAPEARAEFPFAGRNRRPPRDPFNAVLSYLYALLFHDCVNALRSEGLETRLGFLHAPHRGRHSLALDLMEELRPLVADRLALALVNRRQLRATHFTTDPATGAVLLGPEGRRTLFQSRALRQTETIVPPGGTTPIPWRDVPRHQAHLLAASLRAGDPELYAPFTPRL